MSKAAAHTVSFEDTQPVLFVFPERYAILDGGVYMAAHKVHIANLTFPKKGDIVTFAKEAHTTGKNPWRVSKVFSIRYKDKTSGPCQASSKATVDSGAAEARKDKGTSDLQDSTKAMTAPPKGKNTGDTLQRAARTAEPAVPSKEREKIKKGMAKADASPEAKNSVIAMDAAAQPKDRGKSKAKDAIDVDGCSQVDSKSHGDDHGRWKTKGSTDMHGKEPSGKWWMKEVVEVPGKWHPKEDALSRVVRRLKTKLEHGPEVIYGLRGFLGNPAMGGCKEDMEVVDDWHQFAKEHQDLFEYNAQGPLPRLGLVNAFMKEEHWEKQENIEKAQSWLCSVIKKVDLPIDLSKLAAQLVEQFPQFVSVSSEFEVQQSVPKTFEDFVRQTIDAQQASLGTFEVISKDGVAVLSATKAGKATPSDSKAISEAHTPHQAVPPSGTQDTTCKATLEVEENIIQRLERKLQAGPKSITALKLFVSSPSEGGNERDMEIIGDWQTFVRRHCDKFVYDASGKVPVVGLIGKMAAPDARKSPPLDWDDDLLDAQSLLCKILSTFTFPIALRKISNHMAHQYPHYQRALSQIGKWRRGPSSFAEFVKCTLDRNPDTLGALRMVSEASGLSLAIKPGATFGKVGPSKGIQENARTSVGTPCHTSHPDETHARYNTTTSKSYTAVSSSGTSSYDQFDKSLTEDSEYYEAEVTYSRFERYAFLYPDVYLDGDKVWDAGLRFPQQGDIVKFTKERHLRGGNRWRVTRVISITSAKASSNEVAHSDTEDKKDDDGDGSPVSPPVGEELKNAAVDAFDEQPMQSAEGAQSSANSRIVGSSCDPFSGDTPSITSPVDADNTSHGALVQESSSDQPYIRPTQDGAESHSPSPALEVGDIMDTQHSTDTIELTSDTILATLPAEPYTYVTTACQLLKACGDIAVLYSPLWLNATTLPLGSVPPMAVGCEGLPEDIFLLEMATARGVYIFDCLQIGLAQVCAAVRPFLECPGIIKLIHDLHQDAAALARHNVRMRGVLDTQLAYEHLQGYLLCSLPMFLDHFDVGHRLKLAMRRRVKGDKCAVWNVRPLATDYLECVAMEIEMLLQCHSKLATALGPMGVGRVIRASEFRAELAAAAEKDDRLICFDCQHSYCIHSYELLLASRAEDVLPPPTIVVDQSGAIALVKLLPMDLQSSALDHVEGLDAIVLDKGRRPYAFFGKCRVFLLEDEAYLVKQIHIDAIVRQIGQSNFGPNNRAILDQSLNCISAIRNPVGNITGLTMRVGKTVNGISFMLTDILLGPEEFNILILGEPKSGKTTIMRDIACLLAKQHHVVIVDTYNDISGSGDIPHSSVGLARRMTVQSPQTQGTVMMECLCNHYPSVIVVDDIGYERDVEAACTIKRRGVRLIAGVQGNLRQLVKSKPLRGLLGYFEQTMSPSGNVKTKRTSEPIFDCVVELQSSGHCDLVVVHNVVEAVDSILDGKQYRACRRVHDPVTNFVRIELFHG